MEFSADVNAMKNCVSDLKSIHRKLNTYSNEIARINRAIDWKIKSIGLISVNLSSLSRNVQKQSEKTNNMGTKLNDISDLYNNAENKVKNMSYDKTDSSSGKSNSNKIEFSFMDFIEKFGYFGSGMAFINGIIESIKSRDYGKLTTTALKAIKSLKDLSEDFVEFGKAARTSGGTKPSWFDKIFGLNDYDDAAKAAKAASTAKDAKVKGISKVPWLDILITGTENFFDNREEQKSGNMSDGRFWGETITETAVDLAFDAGAAVVVGAIATTLIGGAPFVVVGLGVAAVKWGADSIAKWMTGGEKDFTEVASDFILDTGKALADDISDGLKNVGDGIRASIESITTKWKFSFGF